MLIYELGNSGSIMNTKLLASFAVFVLLAAVVSVSMTDTAIAATEKKTDKKTTTAKTTTAKTTTAKTTAASGKAVKEATIEMVKGTGTNTNCADKCYSPNSVTVAVGGKVTWKNVDSAAHSATAMDSSFDTSLVNAGASASNTFNTAGTYQYMCIVHPWMKGTVIVK